MPFGIASRNLPSASVYTDPRPDPPDNEIEAQRIGVPFSSKTEPESTEVDVSITAVAATAVITTVDVNVTLDASVYEMLSVNPVVPSDGVTKYASPSSSVYADVLFHCRSTPFSSHHSPRGK